MTKVYLTRHGETEWNTQHKFQGHGNSELTDKGILGAELLANRIEEIDIDCIAASPLKRAYETAKILKGKRDIELITHQGLKEINVGDFEGMSYADIKRESTELINFIEEDPFNNPYPNGENLMEFYNRVKSAFFELVEKYRNKTILIVAHGGTIKCIETLSREFEIDKDWIGKAVKNCSLSYLEVDENNKVKEIFFNDTKHLEESSALN